MSFNLTIKGIGHKEGTVGWLKDGLEKGTIEIVEGKTNGGKHGLFLHHGNNKELGQTLALWDPYGLGDMWGHEAEADYEMAPRESDCAWYLGEIPPWTEAAWKVLEEISRKWISHRKEERKNDPGMEVVVIFKE